MGERAPLSLALENSKLQHAIVVPSSLIAARLSDLLRSKHQQTIIHQIGTCIRMRQYLLTELPQSDSKRAFRRGRRGRVSDCVGLCRILGLDSSRQTTKLPLCAWHASVLR